MRHSAKQVLLVCETEDSDCTTVYWVCCTCLVLHGWFVKLPIRVGWFVKLPIRVGQFVKLPIRVGRFVKLPIFFLALRRGTVLPTCVMAERLCWLHQLYPAHATGSNTRKMAKCVTANSKLGTFNQKGFFCWLFIINTSSKSSFH